MITLCDVITERSTSYESVFILKHFLCILRLAIFFNLGAVHKRRDTNALFRSPPSTM